MTQFKLSVVIC